MNLKAFFKQFGHLFLKTFQIIKRIVPDEQLVEGIRIVKEASERFVENEARRAWAIAQLRSKLPISESVARLIVELAVQHIKDDLIEKVADEVEDAVTD